MNGSTILKYGVLLIFLAAHPLQAETPKEFFPSSFADTPLSEQEPPPARPPARQHPEEVPAVLPEGLSSIEELTRKAQEIANPSIKVQEVDPSGPASPLPDDRPGVPIEWIGGVIEASDTAHFTKTLEELLQFAARHDWTVGNLYINGTPEINYTLEKLSISLSLRGADIEYVSRVPDEYPVKTSPTWIVATKRGEILLEGVGALGEFINARGEFAPYSAPQSDPEGK